MAIEVKICGVNAPEALRAAVEGGAEYVGLNFYPPSPRSVTPDRAAALTAAAPIAALVWGVSEVLGALLFAEAAPGQDGLPAVAQMEAFVEANLGALLLIQTITAAINYVLMALMVSVISIAFRTCTGWVPDVGGAVVSRGESVDD